MWRPQKQKSYQIFPSSSISIHYLGKLTGDYFVCRLSFEHILVKTQCSVAHNSGTHTLLHTCRCLVPVSVFKFTVCILWLFQKRISDFDHYLVQQTQRRGAELEQAKGKTDERDATQQKTKNGQHKSFTHSQSFVCLVGNLNQFCGITDDGIF